VSAKTERWWKRVSIAIGVAGLVGILWTASIWYEYQRVLPRRPDQPAGRVYPLNVHGIVVYQTREERDWLNEIQYSSIALFAASALMAAIYKKKFGTPPVPPSHRFGRTGGPGHFSLWL